jgi:hypothetical protein
LPLPPPPPPPPSLSTGAFGMTSYLLHAGIGRAGVRSRLVLFSLAAPTGALLTYWLLSLNLFSYKQVRQAGRGRGEATTRRPPQPPSPGRRPPPQPTISASFRSVYARRSRWRCACCSAVARSCTSPRHTCCPRSRRVSAAQWWCDSGREASRAAPLPRGCCRRVRCLPPCGVSRHHHRAPRPRSPRAPCPFATPQPTRTWRRTTTRTRATAAVAAVASTARPPCGGRRCSRWWRARCCRSSSTWATGTEQRRPGQARLAVRRGRHGRCAWQRRRRRRERAVGGDSALSEQARRATSAGGGRVPRVPSGSACRRSAAGTATATPCTGSASRFRSRGAHSRRTPTAPVCGSHISYSARASLYAPFTLRARRAPPVSHHLCGRELTTCLFFAGAPFAPTLQPSPGLAEDASR